jgi:alpha-1,3-rhamnosyltransferase
MSTYGSPLVSIVVPVFNHERFVRATITSLIDQTYQNLELLIVDDGSTDKSLNAVRMLESSCRSRFARFELMQQANSGTAAALNRGIEASRGSFLFWLASDDLAEPDTISSLLPELISDPDVGLACGDADFIDAGGRPTTRTRGGKEFRSSIDYYLAEKPDFDLKADFGSYRSFIGPYYMPIGCLVRHSHFLAAGYFDPTYVSEDSDLWLRLSKICRFQLLPRTLCHRRLHSTNTHLTMRERLSLDDIRLLIREAEYCINHGLADQWQAYIEKRVAQHHRLLTQRRPAQVGWLRDFFARMGSHQNTSRCRSL